MSCLENAGIQHAVTFARFEICWLHPETPPLLRTWNYFNNLTKIFINSFVQNFQLFKFLFFVYNVINMKMLGDIEAQLYHANR